MHTLSANLTQLRHFVALAESGSFTRAAGHANRSQAAFSRSIAMLEAQLNVALIDRIGHRNELTPIGRTVLEHARHVIADVDELAQVVKLHAKGAAGHFRIGLGSTPSALLMSDLLTYAAKHRSAMRITLSRGSVEQQVQALRERQLDALVVDMRSVLPTPDLHIEQLAQLRTGVLCRAGHPLSRRKRLKFDDLLRYPIASTSISDEIARTLVDNFGPQAHPSAFITLCCEDVASLLDATRLSDAVFIGVVAVAKNFLDSGDLVELTFSATDLDARFAVVRLAGRSTAPTFAKLVEFMRERLHD